MKAVLLLVCVFTLAAAAIGRAQEGLASPAAHTAASGPPVPAPSPDAAAVPAPVAAKANPAQALRKAAFWKRMFTLEAFTATVPGALMEQLHDWPNEWPRNRFGLGKRVASLYGQFVVGAAIEDGVRALDKEDTAYRRLATGNFFRRTSHVVTGTLVARRPGDHHTFAFSVAANAYGSWAIATLWSPPELRNARSIFGWGSANMGSFAIGNFVREFWPDVKAVFHRKPKSDPPHPSVAPAIASTL